MLLLVVSNSFSIFTAMTFTYWLNRGFFLGLVSLLFVACKPDESLVPNNTAPYYAGIPTVKVENYVNRLYIDLIGREPLDVEMTRDVAFLRSKTLSMESRDSLINMLMFDVTPLPGDSSYKTAYYRRLYEIFKFRTLEGASDGAIYEEMGPIQFGITLDSLNGDSVAMQIKKAELQKYKNVLSIPILYRDNAVTINDVYARLLNNGIYDFINMNSFNFVRASFQDLYNRFPTEAEFTAAFTMVENNQAQILFGKPGQNKGDLITILTNTPEFYEGMIRWAYRTYLAREAATAEVNTLIFDFVATKNFQNVQRQILKTDEYANF